MEAPKTAIENDGNNLRSIEVLLIRVKQEAEIACQQQGAAGRGNSKTDGMPVLSKCNAG